jgi:glycosyltransferase involved in cell wall biosynthesis
VVCDALYPWHKGGKEIRYSHLLKSLPEHDVDVVVYSMKWWDDTPDVIATPHGSLTYRAICPRVPMYRGAKRSFFQAAIFAISTLRLVTQKFDAIEADHMPILQIIPLRIVAWVKRVPLVITWHEVWGKEGWRSYIGRMGDAAALLERVCIRLPDRIVAGTANTAENLVMTGAKRNRIDVVPNPLDFEQLFATTADPLAPEVLFVGRLIEHKQANLVIDTLRILVDRGHDIRLGLVGVGPEDSRLRTQVEDLALGAHVTFYGAIDEQRDVWSLIRGSQVLLAPSIREGFGLVVAESLALGTPVVCVLHSDNESSDLIGPNTGTLVTTLDAHALADAAEHWLRADCGRPERVSSFLDEHEELSASNLSKSYARILWSVA